MFDRVTIVVWAKEVDTVPPGWHLASGDKVDFCVMPYYQGFGQFLKVSLDLLRFSQQVTKIALSQLAEFSGFTRYVASNLPYGKGGRILLRFLRRRLTFNYFQFNQRYTRKVGLVNQYSLMLEAWK